jgi:prolyl oligopeptidase
VVCVLFSCTNDLTKKPQAARIENVTDEYFGVRVDDPYRYMENLNDTEVQGWIKAQADYTARILAGLPERNKLLNRLKELDAGKAFNTYFILKQMDGSMFFMRRKAEDNIAKLCYQDTEGNQSILVDPEKIVSEDGKHFSIETYSPSANSEYLVYGLAKGGSEQTVFHILNVKTGTALPETIDRVEPEYNRPFWLPDANGFFYVRRQKLPADAPPTEIYKNTRTYFHKLNTDPETDLLVFGIGLSKRVPLMDVDFPSIYIPDHSEYAVGQIKHGDANELTLYSAPISSLLKADIPWKKICDSPDEVMSYDVIGNDVYLMTANKAPRFKVVKTGLDNPDFIKAATVIPAGEQVIESVRAAKDALYVNSTDGGFNQILRLEYGKNAVPESLVLPGDAAGYITFISSKMPGILAYSTSWTKGSLIYEYDPETRAFTDSGLLPKGKFDDMPGLVSKEVKVRSHDGVMVPLSIIYQEGIHFDGRNPAILYGYGSYGLSQSVFFSSSRIAWLERGGVYAIAHVRGGGEYGREWHLAGQKLTKPNTWKDFIACAEYLIQQGYTSKERLACMGGSAGGILTGRAITERPDLFSAAIIMVGSLDAIREETTTNGVPNIPEFGTVKEKDGFKGLYEMSSYHHVKDGVSYPAVLLTHGINDPRVEPWNSAKMTARLQAATSSSRPVLFRVEYDAGHGIGSTRDQRLKEMADVYAFLLWQLDGKK